MAKRPKKRSRTWMWVVGLLIGMVVMAALGSAMLSGLCFWSAVVVLIAAGVRSSPKPIAGRTYDYDDHSYDDDRDRRRRQHDRDRRRDEEQYQAMADAEQRAHEDRGEV